MRADGPTAAPDRSVAVNSFELPILMSGRDASAANTAAITAATASHPGSMARNLGAIIFRRQVLIWQSKQTYARRI